MHCSICGFENSGSVTLCGKCASPLVNPSPERRAAVLKARDSWVAKLIDLSRRNKLLFFRDLKTGTLDLSSNDPKVLSDLLRGDSVTLANLLPGADEVSTSARATEIRRTALSNLEERGWRHYSSPSDLLLGSRRTVEDLPSRRSYWFR